MRKSVFFKLALFIIPVVLAVEIAQLYTEYRTIYNSNYENCERMIKSAAETTSDIFLYFDLNSKDDAETYSKELDKLCNLWGVTYLFAVEPYVETRSEKYLAIGFGKDATEKAKKTRYPGVYVEGTLSDAQIKALKGDKSLTIIHEKNELDDTLICYRVVDKFFDTKKGAYVKADIPILIGAEVSFTGVMETFEERFNSIIIFDLIFTFLLTLSIFIVFYLRIHGPIKKISTRMKNFVSDRDKGVEKLKVKGNDELTEMSRSFNLMTEEIDNYIKDIDNLTKEKHTQSAELNIAKKIQTGLLMPPRYKNKGVSINAIMVAAKNIGGDLYDYKILDDGKIFIAIADVSGKGISAALFMARAITLLHQYALLGYSPSKMLEVYNNTLAESNPNGLFITTFVAIYDPETHKLTYSNAGHNLPYIISDKLIKLDDSTNVAAGIFTDNEYDQNTIILKPGDVLFLYTDGVNEAANTSKEFFGTKRLEKELEKHINKENNTVSEDIFEAVSEFSDGAVQNDDITILTMRVEKTNSKELTLKAEAQNLSEIVKMIYSEESLSKDIKSQLRLIAEEIFINICSYAYNNSGDVTVRLDVLNDQATLTFIDSGKPFDTTADVLDINEYDHENSIGGLGRFIAFEIADDYSYVYKDNKNILKVTKNFI